MCKTKYPDLEDLVKALEKEYDEQKQIQKLQEINSVLLTQYEIRISDNEIIHPLRIEAYYYPYNAPGKFDDKFAHPSSKKVGNFGKLYFIEEKYEAGIELAGTEVKSIRMGNVNLKDSFCIIKDGQLAVHGMHISPYEKGNIFNKDPRRPRRLLMHKREIMRLFGRLKQDGLALIPLSIYFKGPRVKLELGLARGKKLYDKRESAARRDAKREIDRTMKTRNR